MSSTPVRTLIMGAAGRDFHNFNTVYRDDTETEVVAFTAAQIPGIAGRRYPPALAGPRYPDGIPIVDEADLEDICRAERIGRVVFAYSDVPNATVMHAGSRALAAGTDFVLLGPNRTMLTSKLPVIAISAVRTGCGKSQVGRWLSQFLRERELRVGVLRHPMPYGDLEKQAVQRFATRDDLASAACTIEEREEYEPHIEAGGVIFAGVDYARILAAAESEAQVIVWEGGNNDFPFIAPDLHIVLVDALRPEQTTGHHPGETVLRMADIVLVSKSDAAPPENTEKLIATCRDLLGSEVPIIRGGSPVRLDAPDAVAGKKVLIVEDGPTITHGGMPHGAGYAVLRGRDDVTIIDPRESAAPDIARLYEQYPHIGPVLPAAGYGDEQRAALAATINASAAEIVVAATPVDLTAILEIAIPVVRTRYDYADLEDPGLGGIVGDFLRFARFVMRIVVALGGNALLRRGEPAEAVNLHDNVALAADTIATIAAGNEIVVTHGNGPQIGLLALQAEAYDDVAPYPLDILGAESEGMIGYLIDRELRGRLRDREIATLLTQVEIDPQDPAFAHPSKPIGPVYDDATARRIAAERGWTVAPDGPHFRRVVPSPAPVRILEIDTIRLLLEAGVLTICAGGGGIPVSVSPERGAVRGVEAVIDKDRAAALLARELAADLLLLLTDVDGVYENWGGDAARRIATAAPGDLRRLTFEAGSMGPKVEAACDFVEATGGVAAIGALQQAAQILQGAAGTQIHADAAFRALSRVARR